MLIALTHNLQLDSSDEDEAEFDRPETIAFLVDQLRALGHEVEPIEVGGPIEATISRLRSLAPDLVFNTAEGRRGRVREGLWPSIFEELGLAYTGSDAFACVLTLDKRLSKRLAAAEGVPTPQAQLVERLADLDFESVIFPAIVKPNFEGSSKGIAGDCVVTSRARLEAKVATMLGRYPEGVLVERFIAGRDLTVPWVAGLARETGGVLPVAEYRFDAPTIAGEPVIYDFNLKQIARDSVHVRVPAQIEPEQAAALIRLTQKIVKTFGLRDFGRCDFRLDEDGEIHFLEVNALPSLEPGSSLWASAAAVGSKHPTDVLAAILASASARFGIRPQAKRKRRRELLRVGVIHNLKRDPTSEVEAEFDSAATVEAIGAAIRELGHEPVLLEATRELPSVLPGARIDLAFNIAEGFAGRSREAQVPALLELLEIPYTGSDPACLALCLDKSLAKRVAALAGVPTPAWTLMRGPERLPESIGFPAVVKPVAEGSSKGVVGSSVVHDEHELRGLVRQIVTRYDQPALVEAYLPGREFTVGLLGEKRPRVLPAMEIIFTDQSVSHPVYSYGHKKETETGVRFEVPAKVDDALGREISRVARRAFEALGCRDVARIDLRLDGHGRVAFIECNPLPGLSPGFSDLCVVAEAAGLRYHELIGTILEPALRRLRSARRLRSGVRPSVEPEPEPEQTGAAVLEFAAQAPENR
ncbi:MAG TPA: D-alanine--D-alanine ligase [Enhygromyxa sp.]|nr:D-alanine--D-alanine ligase [Enhygromyxa sp.]